MAAPKGMSEEERNHLTSLFHTYDVDNSGQIEKNEFFAICLELHVDSREAENIFNRLDIDKDGTVTLEEFISGFRERHQEEEDDGKKDNESPSREEEMSNQKEVVLSRFDMKSIT